MCKAVSYRSKMCAASWFNALRKSVKLGKHSFILPCLLRKYPLIYLPLQGSSAHNSVYRAVQKYPDSTPRIPPVTVFLVYAQ